MLRTPAQGYGIHVPGGIFKAPFKESMGRLPEPHASNVFCFAQQDALEEISKGREWTWCEVRPDAIVSIGLHSTVAHCVVLIQVPLC